MTKTVLLTRPQRQSVETAGKLWERGWKSRIAPLFIIEPIPAVIDAAKYQAILLTSANAAPALKDLPLLPIYAVGDATAQTARNITQAPVESAAGDAPALIELIKRSLDPAKGPLLYLSGLDRSVDLEAPRLHHRHQRSLRRPPDGKSLRRNHRRPQRMARSSPHSSIPPLPPASSALSWNVRELI